MATIAFSDLAKFLVENHTDLAKKLITSVSNQSWSNSSFSAPTDMLFHLEKPVIRLDLGGTLCHQLKDRDKLDMIGTTLTNTYYALEGKTFYIKHATSGTTSGNNLNLRYYKIPAITDIDEELTPIFLDILFSRLTAVMADNNDEQKRPNPRSKQSDK